MTGDEYFVGFLHKLSDDCRLPFSLLRECAIQFLRKTSARPANVESKGAWCTKVHSDRLEGIEIALVRWPRSRAVVGQAQIRPEFL
jgi:hypothetical protein